VRGKGSEVEEEGTERPSEFSRHSYKSFA
jgi:hypothetical protein